MAIKNLEKKLSGELPVTREELVKLINSWGRTGKFYINKNEYRIVRECEAKECYDLSKLNTSKITDMCNLFMYSKFNGDISNWDVSNVTDMSRMFYCAKNFNQSLDKWNTSNVLDMELMFYSTNFNQALNNWNVSSVTNMHAMFYDAKEFNQALNNWDVNNVINVGYMFTNAWAFEKRFNNGKPLPKNSNELEQWLKENAEKKLTIKTLNKESTPEQKMAIIEDKISNNKTTLDELFKEKNIDPNSKIGLELLKNYNDTHDKLKLELEDLKTQVIDIATNDFNSI